MKTSHFPDMASGCLEYMFSNTPGVRAQGGAFDVNTAPGGAYTVPL